MFDIKIFDGLSTEEKYASMVMAIRGLVDTDDSVVSKLANASALINAIVGRMNWCGFYLDNGKQLELGPFQGMPACTKINYESGVCGRAFSTKKTLRVDDVHNFEGHIACDAASNSELVIPIIKDGVCKGVLDMDSAEFSRFGELEEKYIGECVKIIETYVF
ncbi:GAF domain-containing protein [Peptostreptococcus anaerobius]|uniref:GAF domain-containing protein n=1 Tax=Peptostreptococcus porci TaxID=2652282 RepID=A0A6N7XDS6_9FIRM|nr:GAF domain-containing protein [Peptostreptococcus porci]MDY4129501.1 GAF domain-containing protein [Peptostreptococcus porci]MST61713.1 GAF domain-containing protein [Peptostreptococcus porci]